MTVSDYAKFTVATACWNAAPLEPYNVMMYVAMVFRNQAQAGWFDSDIYECAAHWLEGNPPQSHPDLREPEFRKLLDNIDIVLTNMAADKTDGALWFGPKTSEELIPTGVRITLTAGQTIFMALK